MTRYHSRKFILCCAVLLITSLMVAFQIIPPDMYRDILIANVAAYITGNVWQKGKA
jgi:hypothetical protein